MTNHTTRLYHVCVLINKGSLEPFMCFNHTTAPDSMTFSSHPRNTTKNESPPPPPPPPPNPICTQHTHNHAYNHNLRLCLRSPSNSQGSCAQTILLPRPSNQCSFSWSYLLSRGIGEEIIGPHFTSKHDVIIEVEELVRQAWDAVQMGFYRRRAEGGEVTLVWKQFLKNRHPVLLTCVTTNHSEWKHSLAWKTDTQFCLLVSQPTTLNENTL